MWLLLASWFRFSINIHIPNIRLPNTLICPKFPHGAAHLMHAEGANISINNPLLFPTLPIPAYCSAMLIFSRRFRTTGSQCSDFSTWFFFLSAFGLGSSLLPDVRKRRENTSIDMGSSLVAFKGRARYVLSDADVAQHGGGVGLG